MPGHRFVVRDVLKLFEELSVWKRGDERAPHKPLLVLLALARVQRGAPRLTTFEEIEPKLRSLLEQFGPPRKSVHPEYPFWYLRNDGVWDVPEHEALSAAVAHRARTKDVPPAVLKEHGAQGGFAPDVDAALRADPALLHAVADRVLSAHFPPSIHEDILDEVGLEWEVVQRRTRDPAFREMVLRVYEHRCAVCGFDGRFGQKDLCIEAAHVRWHASGGPDVVENGLALCTIHHKVLDLGAMGIDEGGRVIVSSDVSGRVGVEEWLLRFHGEPLRSPQKGIDGPAAQYVRWHLSQVFRGPARAA